LSATFNHESDKWGVGLYVRNIFDKHYIEGAEPTSNVTAWEYEGLQRNWGARFFFGF
jgi:outer membrane receptor protein involved in Fe transport